MGTAELEERSDAPFQTNTLSDSDNASLDDVSTGEGQAGDALGGRAPSRANRVDSPSAPRLAPSGFLAKVKSLMSLSNSKKDAPAKLAVERERRLFVWKTKLKRKIAPTYNAGAAKAASQQDEPPPGYLGIDFKNRSDGILVVTGIAPDSPVHGAFEIMVGDVILEISGFNLVHLTGDQVWHLCRGPAGTSVELTLAIECFPPKGQLQPLMQDYIAQQRLANGQVIAVARVERHTPHSVLHLPKLEMESSTLNSSTTLDRIGSEASSTGGEAAELDEEERSASFHATRALFAGERRSNGSRGVDQALSNGAENARLKLAGQPLSGDDSPGEMRSSGTSGTSDTLAAHGCSSSDATPRVASEGLALADLQM